MKYLDGIFSSLEDHSLEVSYTCPVSWDRLFTEAGLGLMSKPPRAAVYVPRYVPLHWCTSLQSALLPCTHHRQTIVRPYKWHHKAWPQVTAPQHQQWTLIRRCSCTNCTNKMFNHSPAPAIQVSNPQVCGSAAEPLKFAALLLSLSWSLAPASNQRRGSCSHKLIGLGVGIDYAHYPTEGWPQGLIPQKMVCWPSHSYSIVWHRCRLYTALAALNVRHVGIR